MCQSDRFYQNRFCLNYSKISKLQFSFFLQFFLDLGSCWLKSSINCLHFWERLDNCYGFITGYERS